VGQCRWLSDSLKSYAKRVVKIAKDHVIVVGNAVGMSGDPAIKDEYLASWQSLTQMIEGTAVTQPQFHNRPWNAADKPHRCVETVALCRDSA
jgi:hypothetical protein